ncbi:MAG: YqeG family HAD IIIA-type phosphatase [Trueperaceae bacterium]
MLMPDVVVTAAYDATPELLRGHGVRAVMVDLDDTLMASNESEFGAGTREWLEDLRASGMPVLLLSNGERGRVERCCADLGLEGFHLAGKPFWWAFRKGLRRLGRPASETAMIGDQLFTDVLGANLAGMVSVLVSPLSPGKMPHTRAIRHLERLILRGGGNGSSVDR